MPNLVKHVEDPKKTAAMTAVMTALRAIPADLRSTKQYKVATVCVLLDKDPKTLFNARKARLKALKEDPASIHPLSLESIDFVDSPPAAVYMAQDLIDYLDRFAKARMLRPWEQSNPENYASKTASYAFLGFQTWLVEAMPTELWPFSIQKDGRPMDMIAAMFADKVTDELEWMTIREFGERAAHAASDAFACVEAEGIGVGVRIPDPLPAPPPNGIREPRGTGL